MGVIFFGITAIMIKRQNSTFLTHKAGHDLHYMTDEALDETLWSTIYTLIVSAILSAFLCRC